MNKFLLNGMGLTSDLCVEFIASENSFGFLVFFAFIINIMGY
jgi:hypothetical protein